MVVAHRRFGFVGAVHLCTMFAAYPDFQKEAVGVRSEVCLPGNLSVFLLTLSIIN